MKMDQQSGAQWLRFALKVIASISLLIVAANNIDLTTAMKVIRSVAWWYWPTSFSLNVIIQLINAKRWHVLSRHVPFRELLRQTFVSNVYAFIVPSALVVDAAKVISVPKALDGFAGATARVAIDKIIGIVVVVLLLMPALYFSSSTVFAPVRIFFTIAISTTLVGFGLFLIPSIRSSVYKVANDIATRIPTKLLYQSTISKVITKLQLVELPNKSIITNLILAFTFQAIILVSLYLAALSVHINISFWDVVLLSSIIQLSFFIPVGFAGIGVKDIAQVTYLISLGVSKQTALTMVLLGYPVTIAIVLFGLFLLILPLVQRNRGREPRNKNVAIHDSRCSPLDQTKGNGRPQL
jgi:uncharacterized membrane protein YbhN (UPF0104 family)